MEAYIGRSAYGSCSCYSAQRQATLAKYIENSATVVARFVMSSRFQSKSPSVIGAISRHHNGWRVAFKFGGRTTSGPIRTHKSDAELDLERARAARTHQEYSDILHVLRKTAESQRKINK